MRHIFIKIFRHDRPLIEHPCWAMFKSTYEGASLDLYWSYIVMWNLWKWWIPIMQNPAQPHSCNMCAYAIMISYDTNKSYLRIWQDPRKGLQMVSQMFEDDLTWPQCSKFDSDTRREVHQRPPPSLLSCILPRQAHYHMSGSIICLNMENLMARSRLSGSHFQSYGPGSSSWKLKQPFWLI